MDEFKLVPFDQKAMASLTQKVDRILNDATRVPSISRLVGARKKNGLTVTIGLAKDGTGSMSGNVITVQTLFKDWLLRLMSQMPQPILNLYGDKVKFAGVDVVFGDMTVDEPPFFNATVIPPTLFSTDHPLIKNAEAFHCSYGGGGNSHESQLAALAIICGLNNIGIGGNILQAVLNDASLYETREVNDDLIIDIARLLLSGLSSDHRQKNDKTTHPTAQEAYAKLVEEKEKLNVEPPDIMILVTDEPPETVISGQGKQNILLGDPEVYIHPEQYHAGLIAQALVELQRRPQIVTITPDEGYEQYSLKQLWSAQMALMRNHELDAQWLDLNKLQLQNATPLNGTSLRLFDQLLGDGIIHTVERDLKQITARFDK